MSEREAFERIKAEASNLGYVLVREPERASAEARTIWRHKKRGTTYRVLHDNAPMQEEQTEGRRLDDEPMVIYQDVNSGSVYVRPVVEFYDGRFEALSHQPDAAEPNASAEARLREAVTRLADVSEAFLRYFNPANDLSSDKEDQWWSVYDQIKRSRDALSAHHHASDCATLSRPAGERREAIARIICYWDQTGTCHDNYCGGSCRAKKPNAEFFKAADAILASGLVQDEAGWRDISTAPRDGTVIFVRRDNGCSLDYMVVWWNDTHNDGYPWRSDNNAYAEDRWDEWMLPPIRSARNGGGS